MAEARAPGTPFERLATALGGRARTESRDGATVEVFEVERGAAVIEVSLSHGAPLMLVLRAHEDEPAPSSGLKQTARARARMRLVYPQMLARRVTPLDRVNTLFALRFEVRTGDARFDGGVTIEGDVSDQVISQTFRSQGARDAVLEILAAGMTVRCVERAICAELASPGEAHLSAAALSPVLAALEQLVADVPRADASVFDRRPQAGRVITSAIVVTGILGAAALAPGTFDDPGIPVRLLPRPILPLPFMLPGIGVGALAFVAGYLLLRWQLKRRNASTDLPLVLALFVVLATLGVGLLDDAPLAMHEARVVGKETGTSRKSGQVNEWFLIVPSWHADATELELSVESELHRATRVGDRLRVTVHSGFFGWEWGAVVERLPGSALPDLPLEPPGRGDSLPPGRGDSLPPGRGDSLPPGREEP